MSERKVIFLDIDGVLNNSRSVAVKIGPTVTISEQVRALDRDHGGLPYGVKFALQTVDPICVALLNRLLAESGAGIVLSSTHRKHYQDLGGFNSDQHKAVLRQYLIAMGINVPEFFDVTPKLHGPRGDEVQAWLMEQDDVTRYAILDDGKDFMGSQDLVWCDPNVGFDYKNYVECCRFLGLKEPSVILI